MSPKSKSTGGDGRRSDSVAILIAAAMLQRALLLRYMYFLFTHLLGLGYRFTGRLYIDLSVDSS